MAVPEKQWPDFLQPDLQLGAKYHLIQEGMTKGEVHAILGPPTEPSYSTADMPPHASSGGRWKSKGQYIGISFSYGRVTTITQQGLE